ncbi:MAG: ABC transporter permease [Cytophagales bacterium]|nr:ABC transporter permease [Cytophagales bacterium]
MSPHPPRWADRFLQWFCRRDILEDLQGDLYEIFDHVVAVKGQRRASWIFVWLVFRSFRPSAIRLNVKVKNSIFMQSKINLKVAFRVLKRDRSNSLINLLGLTIGISCFILLGLYVKQELSYDHFHSKKDRIYRSWLKEDYGEGKIFFNSNTPLRFESLLEENFPEVERSVQITRFEFLTGKGENKLREEVYVVSPDLLEVFDFKLLAGNPESPIPTRNDLLISEQFARKYFGNENPVGQPFYLSIGPELREFTITALMADIPSESSVQFDLAISSANDDILYDDRVRQAWFTIIPETYVLINENSSIQTVEAGMQDVVMSYLEGEVERDVYQIGFQPLTDIHLNPDIPLGFAPVGNPEYVSILGFVGILVLIIACINYTTLSAGQSIKRAKEVGVRKVMGAPRKGLMGQYLTESVLMSQVAMLLGTVIAIVLIPTFNLLTGVTLSYAFQWWHIGLYFAIGLFIGLLAGAYPALVISGFKTVSILRGSLQSVGGMSVRKGLVVVQFLMTVFLLSTTLIMKKQVNYLKNADLGYDYEAVISTQLPSDPEAQRLSQQITSGMENGELLKARLEQYPEISRIARGSHIFGTNGWTGLAYTDDKGVFRQFRLLVVDDDYLDAFGIEIVDGRGFEANNGLDRRQSVILNETAAKYFDLEKPVGSKLPGNDFDEHRIIGVAKDFHFTSLHSEIEPLVIVQNIIPIARGVSDSDFGDTVVPKLVFTYSGSNLTKGTEILQKEWEALFPNVSWNFEFISENLQNQYQGEIRMNRLITVATVLSIVIASLGLLGLIMLVANAKLKEIGIRKVMGASAGAIFKLLSKGFVWQLLIAIVLSIPLTIWLMNSWLENFAYRTDIGAGLFVISALLSVIVAGLVILYHTVRAMRVNPIKSLRME